MVYSNIGFREENGAMDGKLRECLEYARSHDLLSLEEGSYPIRDKEIVLNINRYIASGPETRGWESHRLHADLQLILKGRERIDLNFIDCMKEGEYDEARDFLPLTGVPAAGVVLKEGDYALLYPEDAHMPGIAPDAPAPVVKAVFKILL